MNHFLEKILHNKMLEVQALKKHMVRDQHIEKTYDGKFKHALLNGSAGRIIAEIKRCSPSKGMLAEIPDAAKLAACYAEAGAVAVSVLTEQKFFLGALKDLENVSHTLRNTACAVLRKDFIIDTVQLMESVQYGADAVLLIACVLKNQLPLFIETAYSLGLDCLVEVHDEKECMEAIASGAQIIGVNHRNLNSFQMIEDRAISLLQHIPANILKVAESGIHTETRAAELCLAGFDAVLIGESLVKAEKPNLFIQQVQQLCIQK